MRNFLEDFYEFVRIPAPPSLVGHGPRLFPRTLRMPGWRHIFDNAIKRGLTSQLWFPRFLQALKGVVAFFRDCNLVDTLCKDLKRRNFHGIASLVADKLSSLSSFAKWRWTTINDSVLPISQVIASLREVWDPRPFRNMRDRDVLCHMNYAMGNADWLYQLRFTTWFAQWLTSLMNWIGLCDCHPDAPSNFTCIFRGRRIAQAYDYACTKLDSGKAFAESWIIPQWGVTCLEVLNNMIGAVRFAHYYLRRGLEFLDVIPFLLARLDMPGVVARCLSQYAASPAESHDEVSHEFLNPDSPLYADVLLVDPNGGNVSAVLQHEIQSLRFEPMDDTIIEGPHAGAARRFEFNRSAKWAWIASSMRLKDNVTYCHEFSALTGLELNDVWRKYKKVVPMSRCGRKQFELNVYGMKHLLEDGMGAIGEADEPAHAAGDGGGGGGGGGRGDGHDRRGPLDDFPSDGGGRSSNSAGSGDNSSDFGGSGVGGDDSGGGGGGGGAGHSALSFGKRLRKNSEFVKLARDWLANSLVQFSFISINDVNNVSGSEEPKFFQVVRLEAPEVIVETHLTRTQEHGAYDIVVQPFEVWLGDKEVVTCDPNDIVYLFPLEDPRKLDLLDHLDGISSLDFRNHLRLWEPCECKVADLNCVSVKAPKFLEPTMSWVSDKFPVICLMDRLGIHGWESKRGRCVHSPEDRKVYDSRSAVSKRHYYKCLLQLETLFSKCAKAFDSTQSQSFYTWLLADPGRARCGQSAKACSEALALLNQKSTQPPKRSQCGNSDSESSEFDTGQVFATKTSLKKRRSSSSNIASTGTLGVCPPEPTSSPVDVLIVRLLLLDL